MKFFQIFLNKTISLLYIFITLTLIFVNGFSNEPSELHQVYDNNTKRCDLDCNILINHAETLGDVRVIVDLNVPELSRLQLNSSLNNDDIDIRELERKRLVAQAQEQLLKRISQYHLIYQYKTVASIVLKANANTLQMMINDPNVLRLSLDKPTYTSLVESNPLIGTDQAWEKGFTGKNYTIAILDTGIDKTHPFLQGKVIDEACFSSTDSGKDPIYGPWETKSLCPNSQLNTNDTPGQPCEDLVGCDHGTHVAGIIAGTGNEFSGVARDADVISIQVFAQGERGICGSNPSPCLVSLMSDQIAALDAIYDDLRNKHTIVAINMSLGGGYYKTICDDDMPNAYKQVMELLKNKSISTIVASGNNGYIDGIAAPACISSTVSVGSTTKENNVSSFSNSVDFLTMLAPGGLGAGNQLDIYSSLPNGFFGYKAGTSMAAPHVAGAFAIVQQQSPTAKTSQILSLLTSHGKPIKDIRNTLTKPRLRLDNMPWLTNTVADEIHNLGMDHKKNIYAGYVGDDGSFIIKYSSSGKEEWRIDFDTYIEDMTFDEDGNTYAVMYMSDWDYDDRIVKYNSNGELVWETGFDDYTTTDIIVDDNGSVYVLGKNDEERKMGVLKFDRDGKREWEGIDTESSHFLWDSNQRDLMVVDKNHNVYAAVKKDCTGNCPYTSYETRIIKFNTSGKYEWAKTVHIEDSTENYEWLENLPSYIAIDDEANIYVAGWVCWPYEEDGTDEGCPEHIPTFRSGSSNFGYLMLLKYNSNGELLWSEISNAGGLGAVGQKIVVDKNNDVYIGGVICRKLSLEEEICADNDYLVMKYTPQGTLVWKSIISGKPHRSEGVTDIILNSENDGLYVTGFTCEALDSSYDTCEEYTARTLLYDAKSGEIMWMSTQNATPFTYNFPSMLAGIADSISLVTYDDADGFFRENFAVIQYTPDLEQK